MTITNTLHVMYFSKRFELDRTGVVFAFSRAPGQRDEGGMSNITPSLPG